MERDNAGLGGFREDLAFGEVHHRRDEWAAVDMPALVDSANLAEGQMAFPVDPVVSCREPCHAAVGAPHASHVG